MKRLASLTAVDFQVASFNGFLPQQLAVMGDMPNLRTATIRVQDGLGKLPLRLLSGSPGAPELETLRLCFHQTALDGVEPDQQTPLHVKRLVLEGRCVENEVDNMYVVGALRGLQSVQLAAPGVLGCSDMDAVRALTELRNIKVYHHSTTWMEFDCELKVLDGVVAPIEWSPRVWPAPLYAILGSPSCGPCGSLASLCLVGNPLASYTPRFTGVEHLSRLTCLESLELRGLQPATGEDRALLDQVLGRMPSLRTKRLVFSPSAGAAGPSGLAG